MEFQILGGGEAKTATKLTFRNGLRMLRVVYQHLQIHRMKFKTLDVVETKTTTKLTFRNGLHVLGVIDQHLQIHEISNFRRYGSKDDNKTAFQNGLRMLRVVYQHLQFHRIHIFMRGEQRRQENWHFRMVSMLSGSYSSTGKSTKFQTLGGIGAKTTTKLIFWNGLHILGVVYQHLQIHCMKTTL